MPLSALHPCSYPGCTELVRHGRCAEHAREDAERTHDPKSQRLYNSKAWKRIRSNQLRKEPLCAECLKVGIITPATDVDHITPHRGDAAAFYRGPFQSLCHACHSRKTAKEVLNG